LLIEVDGRFVGGSDRLVRKIRGLAVRVAKELHGATSRCRGMSGVRRSARGAAPPDAAQLDIIRQRADAALAGNVMPFWASHAVDDQHGGFVTHLDRACRWHGTTDKYLVPQARLVWTFAAAHRHGLVGKDYLDIAAAGAKFLVERMWDEKAGGFYWAVRREGQPLIAGKRTYGQAFAIFGLAEYALAADDQWARDWAVKTFDVLTERAGDGALGFREQFDEHWRPIPGPAGAGKTVNVHLHLLEALERLFQATGEAAHAAQLRGIVDLVLSRGIHQRHIYAMDDLLENDWRWRTSSPLRTSYGHNVELAWLVQDATDRLGDPPERVRGYVLGLIDHALRFGFDHSRGGLALAGPPLGQARFAWYLGADVLIKRWWEQAEMLVATLTAYELTRDAHYLIAFERQFDWVWKHQLDHDQGDWFATTDWRHGRPLTDIKGHDWKEPYHGARALMEVSRRLGLLLGQSDRQASFGSQSQ
jgi:mannose/cellobiose epimerase-like protein (N-acyl-D-glucosamine 2-epimerase family)